MTHIAFFGNRLTGHIPESLCSLPNLKGLLLHDNCLTGPVPQRLAELVNLRALSLYTNSLTGSFPSPCDVIYCSFD